MGILRMPSDRIVDSTDNNEYAEDMRDENLVGEDLWDSEIPEDDEIPDGIDELGEGERPLYDEEGYEHEPGE